MPGPPKPQSHLSPHHELLPPSLQPTPEAREQAEQQQKQQHHQNQNPTMASQELTLTSTFPLLHSSARIPILGFGIYGSTKPTTIKSCLHALKTGYRHIDGAQYYRNELEMGEAARQSKIPRDQVFLTTKIISPGGSPENTYRKCLESVKTIGIGEDEKEDPAHPAYVDLFLVHTPNGGKESRKEMWLALERLQKEGRARSIGVSNFGVSHVEEMKEYASAWPPAVNQIELHPFCQQRTIVSYCHTHNIIIEAYSPLVRNQRAHDETLVSLSKQHGKTTTQILLRYCLQKTWIPLPKSDTPSRIEENAEIFGWNLGEEDMAKLDGLDQGADGAIVEAVKN